MAFIYHGTETWKRGWRERLLLVTFQTSFYGNFDFLDN